MTSNKHEWAVPLSASPHIFVGRKPAAVLFGKEWADVKSWREVFTLILSKCDQDVKHHEVLMYLRDRAAGKCRVFLSGRPDGMTRPYKINDGLYAETHYGSQTLIHILVHRILAPAHYDYSKISIVMKS